jgi:hypothetical protein
MNRITPRSKIVLEKLIFILLVKNIPSIVELKYYYHVYKNSPFGPVLTQKNPVNNHVLFFSDPFCYYPPSTPRLQSNLFPLGSPNSLLYTSLFRTFFSMSYINTRKFKYINL